MQRWGSKKSTLVWGTSSQCQVESLGKDINGIWKTWAPTRWGVNGGRSSESEAPRCTVVSESEATHLPETSGTGGGERRARRAQGCTTYEGDLTPT